jgi:hypothetical protein
MWLDQKIVILYYESPLYVTHREGIRRADNRHQDVKINLSRSGAARNILTLPDQV